VKFVISVPLVSPNGIAIKMTVKPSRSIISGEKAKR